MLLSSSSFHLVTIQNREDAITVVYNVHEKNLLVSDVECGSYKKGSYIHKLAEDAALWWAENTDDCWGGGDLNN